MLLSDILDIHNSYQHEQCQCDILGDAFLMQSNPVYQKVRSFSLELGCVYVEAYPQYLLLPFHELQTIVESKKVPYVPAARLMAGLERGRPGTFTSEDVPMPESYHLHEASHVIAEHFYKKVEIRSPQEKILKAILCESFANTADALACVPALDDVHRFFITQNCYMHPSKNVMQAMASLTAELGSRYTFMLTFFTYVHANFLAKPMGKKSIKELSAQYAPKAKLNAKLLKHSQTVCALGEKLDPRFRVTTTGNFLKMEGFEGEIFDMLDFPFMKLFAANEGFREATEALCGVLT